jgi:hypothetical protein
MLCDQRSHLLTALIAGIAPIAVLAKSFPPYHLSSSTRANLSAQHASEVLYETGIAGLLIYSVLTLLPLAAAIGYWSRLSAREELVI